MDKFCRISIECRVNRPNSRIFKQKADIATTARSEVIEEDTAFDPKEGFRLIFVSQKPCPAFLVDKVECFVVQVSEKQKEENAGVWGGGEKPVEKRPKEQQTMDNDMRDAAFDGDLETVLLCSDSLNKVSSVLTLFLIEM